MSVNAGAVRLSIAGPVANILFDRAGAHNAMTWAMYEQLEAACASIAADASVRVVVLRGAGGKAFVSGTDIEQFSHFASGEDGIAYERRLDAIIDALEGLTQPVIAVVDGWCMGGGLLIAAVCDFRLATPAARFGVPVARTLGNCLSIASLARVVAALGAPVAKRLVMGAESLGAEEAEARGFVYACVGAEDIDARLAELVTRLASQAPLTMRVAKEGMRRLQRAAIPDGDDLVRLCYGSADFKEGVASFIDKRPARWRGV